MATSPSYWRLSGRAICFRLTRLTHIRQRVGSFPCVENADVVLVCRAMSRSTLWIILVLIVWQWTYATMLPSGEDRHDVDREYVTCGIWHYTVNFHREAPKEALPIKRSGMNLEPASHPRYIDPRLCPRRVNTGHVVSSTRYLECSLSADRCKASL